MEADVKQCHFQLIQTVLIDRRPSHYVLTTSHFNYHSMHQSSESGACVMHLTVDSYSQKLCVHGVEHFYYCLMVPGVTIKPLLRYHHSAWA